MAATLKPSLILKLLTSIESETEIRIVEAIKINLMATQNEMNQNLVIITVAK